MLTGFYILCFAPVCFLLSLLNSVSYPALYSLFPSAICVCVLGLQSLSGSSVSASGLSLFPSLYSLNTLTMIIIVILNSVSISCKLLSLWDIVIELVAWGWGTHVCGHDIHRNVFASQHLLKYYIFFLNLQIVRLPDTIRI